MPQASIEYKRVKKLGVPFSQHLKGHFRGPQGILPLNGYLSYLRPYSSYKWISGVFMWVFRDGEFEYDIFKVVWPQGHHVKVIKCRKGHQICEN